MNNFKEKASRKLVIALPFAYTQAIFIERGYIPDGQPCTKANRVTTFAIARNILSSVLWSLGITVQPSDEFIVKFNVNSEPSAGRVEVYLCPALTREVLGSSAEVPEDTVGKLDYEPTLLVKEKTSLATKILLSLYSSINTTACSGGKERVYFNVAEEAFPKNEDNDVNPYLGLGEIMAQQNGDAYVISPMLIGLDGNSENPPPGDLLNMEVLSAKPDNPEARFGAVFTDFVDSIYVPLDSLVAITSKDGCERNLEWFIKVIKQACIKTKSELVFVCSLPNDLVPWLKARI